MFDVRFHVSQAARNKYKKKTFKMPYHHHHIMLHKDLKFIGRSKHDACDIPEDPLRATYLFSHEL